VTPNRARAILAVLAVAAQLTAACQGPTPSQIPAPGGIPTAATTTARPTAKASQPVRRPKVPAGMMVGYVVFDRAAGRVTLQHNVHRRFRSASVVKILIALDYLAARRAGTEIPANELALLRSMLRSSDDDAATTLWTRGGRVRVIERMIAALRLTDTAPPPAGKPGFWGYTAISAADVVRIYRHLLDPAHRRFGDFIMGHLRRATQCAADGFDQYFGIPAALPRPWAIKQGWSGYGAVPPQRCVRTGTSDYRHRSHTSGRRAAPGVDLVRPVLHTTGTAGPGDRRIVVVLSLQPAGGSWATSVARLTAFTKALYRAGGGRTP
jgi:hypothetical protein